MRDEIPVAGIAEWLRLLLGRRIGFKVVGDSMVPGLLEGERILTDPKAPLSQGDVVLVRHPYKTGVRIIKRLSSIEPDGRLFLEGDNPGASSDSRTFGLISRGDVIGKVISKI
ncbi:MAG TPA: nickel-type superoxide dismutase maturation protease [Pyrinomonadaceae bacterium]|nr:nickel-type superoxide dismutase maturation protease [Pyrinomonadaceae bacterium]